MAFLSLLAGELGDRLHVFASAEGRRIDLERAFADLHDEAEVYLCGPIGMMEAARRTWRACGRAPGRLRIETFGSSGHRPAAEFVVRVIDHERELHVPRDVSLLDVLGNAGIDVAGHCMRGECGLCAVKVVEIDGEIDHRDVVLGDEDKAESHAMCPCVSRVVGRVVVDTGYRHGL
jgi:vanillate O-demethylase ferredoxin subunit